MQDDDKELLITQARRIIQVIDQKADSLKNIQGAAKFMAMTANTSIRSMHKRGEKITEHVATDREKVIMVVRDLAQAASTT